MKPVRTIGAIAIIVSGLSLTAPGLVAQNANHVTVPFSDPSRPGTLKVRLVQGALTVRTTSGREVIVDASGELAQRLERDQNRPARADGLRRLSQPSGVTIEEEANVISITARPNDDGRLDVQVPARIPPAVRTGKLDNPIFLGLIPTRDCNLGCRYCDFAAPKQGGAVIDLDLARRAVDAYLGLLKAAGRNYAEVHFFGGEPFFALEVVQFVVEYAILRAAELGLPNIHFEAITNGLYNTRTCQWIADAFDTVIVSLDGPADIQGIQRPARNGQNPFATIMRNAKIFSESAVELIFRVCVTSQSVGRMSEIADWFGREFRPSTVCFETLNPSALSRAAGFMPPSPWEFARHFVEATRVLDRYGIEIVHSTTSLQSIQTSFCPVGKDALILSPDGALHACYLLPEDWSRNNLDLRLGRVAEGRFEIDEEQLQRIRSLSVYDKALCFGCLCRYHCAGGCHVNHQMAAACHYDDLCIQTRLITIAKLLLQMKQDDLLQEWLENSTAIEATVMQPTDRLFSLELIQ